ncbi:MULTISPECIES: nitrogenase iron-molybdenum cofactor biosynthesis protein NifE [Clostridium]|uniref:nitrogenase iron-molybdenum cofactor biosynthesis protein NifE n=1 Tax=Clostridium TaxID=1485 RepID=UPI00069EE70B|nr:MULTISPECIES: nitrogenase iron-molybdenum cofactor biosynthesis protein NifE [Clostridium]KOF56996.1 nitrogenase iron-molybdenum cofactor biosynthesis protein NifE [Clostridium sp. DMHC 10]MCD2348929.1 nitrogenase iron-molybdenum cofactor biosynthesis protein NifE [Clostridium guangxiense]
MEVESQVLDERKEFVCYNSKNKSSRLRCDENSISGAVSQRACVYCGARVVLNPITDAFHLIHGPIGCASYTWDLRGSLSSGSEIFRNSYSTDLSETDVIFGGEKKLTAAIDEIVEKFNPKVIFVYATCIVGVIGDDIDAVCKKAEEKYSLRIIPVKSPGFSGNKASGYRAACNAILKLIGNKKSKNKINGINYLGDFNLAGEIWVVQSYLKRIGIEVVAKITGDSKYDEIIKAPEAKLNIVQCAGSMEYLGKKMEEIYDIPYIRVSFLGIADTENSLLQIASILGDEDTIKKAEKLIEDEKSKIQKTIQYYRKRLIGKKAAIYVGGGYKAISLIKQFNELGIETVMVGTQTGKPRDYEIIKNITKEGTVILDDANPYELEKFMLEKGADILVGGVKERPLAYKLGVAFCDHNHERKHILSGFEGAVNFAEEIDLTVNSPVWKYV